MTPLEINIFSNTCSLFVSTLVEHAKKNKQLKIGYLNSQTLYLLERSKLYQDYARNCHFLYCDGVGVKLVLNYSHNITLERFSSTDFISKLLVSLSDLKLKMVIVGHKSKDLQHLSRHLKRHYPSLSFELVEGFFLKKDIPNIINEILSYKPNILFVGLGAPRQEAFIMQLTKKENHFPIIPIGAGFLYESGIIKRAPHFMQLLGMEWLWRCIKEPKRLLKRYLICNTHLIYWFFFKRKKWIINKYFE